MQMISVGARDWPLGSKQHALSVSTYRGIHDENRRLANSHWPPLYARATNSVVGVEVGAADEFKQMSLAHIAQPTCACTPALKSTILCLCMVFISTARTLPQARFDASSQTSSIKQFCSWSANDVFGAFLPEHFCLHHLKKRGFSRWFRREAPGPAQQ